MDKKDIKSEFLKTHWEMIESTYNKLKLESEKEDQKESNYFSICQVMIEEWNSIYPTYVLEPIEKDVLSLFQRIQTGEFEKEKSISTKVEVFGVFYYTAQYFYIFVEPFDLNEAYDFTPRFEIKTNDPNRILHHIFGELWNELYPNFDAKEYYHLVGSNLKEYEMLYKFLSKCWLESLDITESTVKAVLSESTGCDNTVYLDGSMTLYH